MDAVLVECVWEGGHRIASLDWRYLIVDKIIVQVVWIEWIIQGITYLQHVIVLHLGAKIKFILGVWSFQSETFKFYLVNGITVL